MVVGNFLLMIGAMGCVYAPSINLLLISRLIQGVGAAASAVVVFAMVADIYQKDAAVKIIGIMNSLFTTLMAIAPIAGAFINKAIGWRGNYGLIAIICCVSWVLLWLYLPETKREQSPLNIKKIIGDYKTLLSSPQFINASILPSLLYTTYISFIACASFLYIETFGMSLMAYALHQSAIVSVFSITSLFASKLSTKFSATKCIQYGMAVCIFGILALVILSLISPSSPYLMTSLMIVFCIGFSIVYPVVFSSSLEIFPELKGIASSAIMGMRTLLCASVIGLISHLYNGQPLMVTLALLSIVSAALVFALQLLKVENIELQK